MSRVSIEKLKGRENFASWKSAMQTWLQQDDLWAVVTGDKDDADGDRKALSKIILYLEPINYSQVQGAVTAKEAWAALTSAFEDKGLTRRLDLLRKLTTVRLENCNNMDEYIDNIITTALNLTEIGFKVNEEWVGNLLLAGLPDQYKPMIMALENSGIRITGDIIKAKLIQDAKAKAAEQARASERIRTRTRSARKHT